jgi:hypothetical protein
VPARNLGSISTMIFVYRNIQFHQEPFVGHQEQLLSMMAFGRMYCGANTAGI